MVATIVFLWDNFGPTHIDRCEAVAEALGSEVVGIELSGASTTYDWRADHSGKFRKITLSAGRAFEHLPLHRRLFLLTKACLSLRGAYFFLCHYERLPVFFTCLLLRVLGHKVFVMNDSKFDDYHRFFWHEAAKRVLYGPYSGALIAASRSADYVRFLGMRPDRVAENYDSISLARIRAAAGTLDQERLTFAERPFVIVSRLVPKKNIAMALDAYALYRAGQAPGQGRRLTICGSGPLEAELKRHAESLGIAPHVDFTGFLQTEEISRRVAGSLALLLTSTEEQFGFVVIEAQALAIPVIVSENCGARDRLVRSGVNGFVVEPDNPQGLAYFMRHLGEDQPLWERMRAASVPFAERGDVRHFVSSVARLCGLTPPRPEP